MSKCCHDSCTFIAKYIRTDTNKRYCNVHKPNDIKLDKLPSFCQYGDCLNRCSYGVNGGKPIYCSSHKSNEMIQLSSKLCEHRGCFKVASYGYEAVWKKRFCATHKKYNMILLNKNKDKKDKSPQQDIPAESIRSGLCAHHECTITGSFGYPGESNKYCRKHMQSGMIQLSSKLCQHNGCGKVASYGLGGKRSFCTSHKQPDMVLIGKKRCEHNTCNKLPHFAFIGEKPRFCSEHKLENMQNVCKTICTMCSGTAIFGVRGEQATRCKAHKTPDMISFDSKTCAFEGCTKYASFGINGQRQYCHTHKSEDMVQLSGKQCCTPNCQTFVSHKNRLKGYCLRCFIYQCPDSPITTCFKIKEKHMVDFINEHFANYTISHDKTIDGGCSKRRPDVLIERYTHVVIIECDEEQHKSYDTTCETQRINDIYTDLGDRSIVLIRFNPDSYIDSNKQKHSTCFNYHKRFGVPYIVDQTKWEDRLNTLKSRIEHHINNIPNDLVTIEHLFYDGYERMTNE